MPPGSLREALALDTRSLKEVAALISVHPVTLSKYTTGAMQLPEARRRALAGLGIEWDETPPAPQPEPAPRPAPPPAPQPAPQPDPAPLVITPPAPAAPPPAPQPAPPAPEKKRGLKLGPVQLVWWDDDED